MLCEELPPVKHHSPSQNVHLAICVSNDVFLSYLISSGFSISHFGFPWNFFSFHTKLLHNPKLTFFANRDFQDGRRPRWVPLGLLSVIHVPFYHKFWKTKTPILPALLKLLSDSLRSLLTRPKSSIFMGRSWSFANTVKKKTFFKSPTVRLSSFENRLGSRI